jgi:GxxExxY protein
MEDFKHKDITDGVINAFYKVYNVLGYGFLEKLYENACFMNLQQLAIGWSSSNRSRFTTKNFK